MQCCSAEGGARLARSRGLWRRRRALPQSPPAAQPTPPPPHQPPSAAARPAGWPARCWCHHSSSTARKHPMPFSSDRSTRCSRCCVLIDSVHQARFTYILETRQPAVQECAHRGVGACHRTWRGGVVVRGWWCCTMVARWAWKAEGSRGRGGSSTRTSLLNCSRPAWAPGCAAATAATVVLTNPVMVRKSSAGRVPPHHFSGTVADRRGRRSGNIAGGMASGVGC